MNSSEMNKVLAFACPRLSHKVLNTSVFLPSDVTKGCSVLVTAACPSVNPKAVQEL